MNTEHAHVANNYIKACDPNSKIFSVLTKTLTYGTTQGVAQARCNTITNNTIINSNSIGYEGSISGAITNSNLYTNNTISTNSTDIFDAAGLYTSAKKTTVLRNGTSQCVQSTNTGNTNSLWYRGFAYLLDESLVNLGACTKTTNIYPCSYLQARP